MKVFSQIGSKDRLFEVMGTVNKVQMNEEDAYDILEEIYKVKKNLNEGVLLEEGVVDVLKQYLKKGVLTTALLSTLLANNIQAQQLVKAGVSEEKVNIAQQLSKEISPQKIENALLNALKKNKQSGTIQQYKSLDQQTKTNILNTIANEVKGDLSKIKNYDLSLYLNRGGEMGADQFKKVSEQRTITVDTTYVDVIKDFETDFDFNSAQLQNQGETKKQLQEFLNSFDNIINITIVASSSTLRNTGAFEGITWEESSQMRVNAIKNLLGGMKYNLGGCNTKETKQITGNIIQQSIKGDNGDGTSGPASPYELDQKSIENYKQQGKPENLWNSKGEDNPYKSKDDYKQHQYVKVVITGEVVKTDTTDVVNLTFLKMSKDVEVDIPSIQTPPGKQGLKRLGCSKQ